MGVAGAHGGDDALLQKAADAVVADRKFSANEYRRLNYLLSLAGRKWGTSKEELIYTDVWADDGNSFSEPVAVSRSCNSTRGRGSEGRTGIIRRQSSAAAGRGSNRKVPVHLVQQTLQLVRKPSDFSCSV
jgi:hypothetical protein